ncbi:MAG: hypothetical protein XD96_1571 [Petrotoga mobilis]|nr:MAG: hypothetical protein XD96_1571 [Petrotoga mobilis]
MNLPNLMKYLHGVIIMEYSFTLIQPRNFSKNRSKSFKHNCTIIQIKKEKENIITKIIEFDFNISIF